MAHYSFYHPNPALPMRYTVAGISENFKLPGLADIRFVPITNYKQSTVVWRQALVCESALNLPPPAALQGHLYMKGANQGTIVTPATLENGRITLPVQTENYFIIGAGLF